MKLVEREQLCYLSYHYLNYFIDFFLDTMEMLQVPYVELVAGHPGVWIDQNGFADVNKLRKKLAERGLKAKVFTPDNCSFLYQIAAPKKEQFELSFRYFKNGMRMASELGCSYMEVNSGWGYWNEDIEESQKRCVDMFQRLSKVGDEFGVTMVLESLRKQETRHGETLEKTKQIYDEVDSERLKIMLDLTAISVAGETIQQWFDTFGNNIVHSHFQDRTPMGHLIWGDGNADLEEDLLTLKKNNYHGLLSAEITDSRYFKDPRYFDTLNIRKLEQYI